MPLLGRFTFIPSISFNFCSMRWGQRLRRRGAACGRYSRGGAGANTATASCGRNREAWLAAQPRRCLRQIQPRRSRGSGLLFARARRRPKQKQGTATRSSAPIFTRAHRRPLGKLAKRKRAVVCFLRERGDARSKNRAPQPGAALQFLQGRTAARRKNWLSARGQWSAFCEGAATPEAKTGHRNPEEGGMVFLRFAALPFITPFLFPFCSLR